MAGRLKKHIHELQVLKKAKPKLRKSLLENAENSLIQCICECCYNILNGNIELTPAEKKKLRTSCSTIRYLGSNKGSLKNKREILVQKGGFLPALIAPIIGLAASIIPEIIRSVK